MNQLTKIAVLLLSLSTSHLFAQQYKITAIDSLLMLTNKSGIFNGNALVAKNDKIIYSASFGYADASKKSKLTANYRFSIGSIHKELSAVCIMILCEQGKLKLDDPVSKYIPSLPKWADKIQIKHLLQYTSGLPNVDLNALKDDNDAFNNLMKSDTLIFEPGTNYNYNYNDILLRQFVIEKITGVLFNEYVEKYLLKPCQMTSAVMNPLKNEKNIAKSYSDDGIEYSTERLVSGLLFLTAEDLFKWTQCLHSKTLINKESIYQIGQGFNGGASGLGNATYENTELIKHVHDGSSKRFQALLYVDLKEKTTIILMTNTKGNKLYEIAVAIESILKNQAYTIPKQSPAAYLNKQFETLTTDDFIVIYNNLRNTKNSEFDFTNEQELNDLGYTLLARKRVDDAIKLFSLNAQQFPLSSNVFNSLGEAFYTKKDFKPALAAYKRCLELNPQDDFTRKMIEKIQKEEIDN